MKTLHRGMTVLLITSVMLAHAHAEIGETAKPEAEQSYDKELALGVVGGVYVAFGTWAYFAWFRNADRNPFFFAWDGFGRHTYAGGADKIGHAWSNYALTRLTTAVLVQGGWKRLPSSLLCAGLAETAYAISEYKDGFIWGFEVHDITANVSGAALAVLMDNVPTVDRLLDFRVEYIPSRQYLRSLRDDGNVDFAQDYTGQSYMLALHLGAIPHLADSDWTFWSRWIDVVGGFQARHYLPIPDDETVRPRQTLFAGIAVNMQGVLEDVFADSRGRRAAHAVFEGISLPFTTLRFGETSRHGDPMAMP